MNTGFETPTPEGLLRERIGLGVAVVAVIAYAAVALDGTSLWLDEAYTLGAVNRLGDSLRGTHGTMGLYYCVMWLWGLVSTATWWLRVPSVIFAIASLVTLRPIARRIGGSDLVAVALPVAALSPMFLWKATEARAYSLETLIVAGCWFIMLWAADAGDDQSARRRYLLMAPLAIAGVFCHGLFVVQLVPIGLLALVGPRPLRALTFLAPAGIAAGSLTLYLREAGGRTIGTTLGGNTADLVRATIDRILGTSTPARSLLLVLLLIGVFLVARIALDPTITRSQRLKVLTPLAWTLIPCITLGLLKNIAPVFNPRYLAPITLGVGLAVGQTLVSAHAAASLSAGTSRRSRAILGGAALVVVAVLAVGVATTMPYLNQDWRSAAETVARGAGPNDALIFANLNESEPVQHRPPFEAAWREFPHDHQPVVISHDRPLGDVQRFDEPRSMPSTVAAAEGFTGLWIVEIQEDGADRTAEFVDRLRQTTSLEVVEQWTFDSEVVVTHLQG